MLAVAVQVAVQATVQVAVRAIVQVADSAADPSVAVVCLASVDWHYNTVDYCR